MKNVYIISELCGQWGGSIKVAEQMILQSKAFGADAVKVQLYDTYKMPGDNRSRWEYLSMKKDQLEELAVYSKQNRIDFFASLFDSERLNWLKDLRLTRQIKIASSLLITNLSLCQEVVECGEQVFCSLGKWKEKTLPFADSKIIYFHCVPEYPHTLERAMECMPLEFSTPLCGYSDHSIGISACVEAVRRGAKYIEKHFTLDKNRQRDTEMAHLCSMDYRDLEALAKICK